MAQFRRCSSISSPPELTVKSPLAPATTAQQEVLKIPEHKNYRSSSLRSRHAAGCNVSRQWSRMRKGIIRPKVFRITNRSGRYKQKLLTTTESKQRVQGQDSWSEETISMEEIHLMRLENVWNLRSESAHRIKGEIVLNTSLGHKYRPKLFPDVAGHEIAVRAISKAVEKMKIASLYLFHGPSGTGKTSIARIFAMALNCESASLAKPCWSCRGCSRSLYIMELCSASRIAGLERIKTLLQSTSFTQAIPGFKVLIIKECHSFNLEVWDELLGMVERAYGSGVVFVLITSDANLVPQNISSRCQKFCFPKLKDKEITMKLEQIVESEGVRIENEALKLIASKAEGSLREAENLLDQLLLLGSTITSSMVQQLVGLPPQNKLVDLLRTAISGDTVNMIRCTRELIATGVEPQTLVSQLTFLITDTLSHAAGGDPASSAASGSSKDKRLLSSSRSQLTNTQSERLCHALKILVETEKQLKSSTDQNSRILAALLEITSEDVCNRISTGIVFQRSATSASGGKPNSDSEDINSQRSLGRTSKIHNHSISRTTEQPDTERIEPGTPIKGIDQTQRSRGKEVENTNLEHRSDMEEIWQNMLDRIESQYMKEFLCHQVKLASLTVSSANVIVHLMFKRKEDKMAAQMSEESVSKALQNAIGCPVTVNMSLEPVDLEIITGNTISTSSQTASSSKQQQRIPFLADFFRSRNFEAAMHQSVPYKSSPLSKNSRSTKFKDCNPSQGQHRCPSEENKVNTLGLLAQKNQFNTSTDPEREILTRARTSIDTAQYITANKPRHRWLSISSIPHSDASVEPYSQDILFEKAHKERERNTRKNHKFQKGFLKIADDCSSHTTTMHQKLNYSWNCTDVLCPRRNNKA